MKFDTKQLRERGFTQHADGSWHKGTPDPSPLASRPPRSVVEPSPESGVDASPQDEAEGKGGGRFQLVIVSYRCALIDCSNACVKWLEDAIVTAGYMPDDGPKTCPAPRFIQMKVPKKEERTEIYLYQLQP